MAKRKKYRIFCVTEDTQVTGFTNLDTPPDECPTDAGHTVNATGKSVIETIELNNIDATVDPTVNDDISAGYAVDSYWINNTSGDTFVCVDNTAGAAVWSKSSPVDSSVFGTCYKYNDNNSSYSTTSESYWQAWRHTTAALPAGDYHIEASFRCKSGLNSKYMTAKVEVDNSNIVCISSCGSDEYINVASFEKMTLGAGTHTIDFDIKCLDAPTAYIFAMKICAWRVS